MKARISGYRKGKRAAVHEIIQGVDGLVVLCKGERAEFYPLTPDDGPVTCLRCIAARSRVQAYLLASQVPSTETG